MSNKFLLILCAAFLFFPQAKAGKPIKPASPDVLQRLAAARTIFVASGGDDLNFADMRHAQGGAYRCLYNAILSWGPYRMVDSPAKADLVFQIRGTETLNEGVDTSGALGAPSSYSYDAHVELYLLEPSAGKPLWYNNSKMKWSMTKGGTEKDFEKAIQTLLAPLQYPPKHSGKWDGPAPVPKQILNAKNIFVQTFSGSETMTEEEEDVYKPLAAMSQYTIVSDRTKADLVVKIGSQRPVDFTSDQNGAVESYSRQQLILTLQDPISDITLWGFVLSTQRTRVETRSDALKRVGQQMADTLRRFVAAPPVKMQ